MWHVVFSSNSVSKNVDGRSCRCATCRRRARPRRGTGPLVGRRARRSITSAPSSACTSTMRPASKRTSSPLHDLAVQCERPRRAHDALGAAAVGRGEHLLGRHVRHVGDAGGGLRLAALPARLGQEPDRQVGAGAAEPQRSTRMSFSGSRARAERARRASRHAATGSSSSSRTQNSTSSHSRVDVRLAEHLRRPSRRSVRRRRPSCSAAR